MSGKTGFGKAEAAEISAQLTEWLLSRDVQVRSGPESGGVFGWFDQAAPRRFLYPEATGYYLAFLAYLAHQAVQSGTIRIYAEQATGWLCRQCGGEEPPPARMYADGDASSDWRSGYSFSFDLAMMWRGIAMSRATRLASALADPALAAVERQLARFVPSSGELRASITLRSGLTETSWASRPGPYQTKCAAALLHSGTRAPEKLRSSAEATLALFDHWRPEAFHPELLHHDLYFVEGLLMAGAAQRDETYLSHAATALERLVAAHRLWLWDECSPYARSDGLAQVLRAGCLLQAAGYLPNDSWSELLPLLACTLSGYCGSGGVMHFRRDSAGSLQHVNVWSGLFAAQALSWFGQWEESALSIEAAAGLI
ncbi:MAG TPA: hypothetical protein VMT32_01650 [Bryobacteraceae bacterium]|nr:hypothetical protein [Bryobacteraceae bacterium]